ncbi:uncharacterized protein PHALS_14573 [Plasmopara halstedii]|uniref:Uncharacterized protein n=1 Tax=Plasmopara halstedii TaxID=4781 RepID=A0A0N7L5L7_PLAHL|nr:uncharacterized protein PHALS_14573 [Plasmopara halstedii]CEG41827.1 hypothetical protein PHALS_14573 [Plasmopara halstedii]|eukprot:XP_024578196.1 hypothetical protein PHALS_14573 [Plasmopara halstedii]
MPTTAPDTSLMGGSFEYFLTCGASADSGSKSCFSPDRYSLYAIGKTTSNGVYRLTVYWVM